MSIQQDRAVSYYEFIAFESRSEDGSNPYPHSTMELTMNVYAHLTDKKQIEALNLLPSPQINPPNNDEENQSSDKT